MIQNLISSNPGNEVDVIANSGLEQLRVDLNVDFLPYCLTYDRIQRNPEMNGAMSAGTLTIYPTECKEYEMGNFDHIIDLMSE